MARACRTPPQTVSVKGYWREAGPRKKKRRATAPRGPYYVAESSTGQTCGHHHRTRSGARRCATEHQRKSRMAHARLTRRQARKTRVARWDVEQKGATNARR